MPLYFFDTHDGDDVVLDDVGLEFPNLEAVKKEAARSLAELAYEVIPGSSRRELAVAVRDARSCPVLRTVVIFEVQLLVSE